MKTASTLLLALAGLAGSGSALAGPYSEALSACLVKSTTAQERTAFVRFVFAAIARHPQVADMSSVSPAEGDRLGKEIAELFWVLLSDRCRTQARDAMQHEGEGAVSSSFGALGKVAMHDLMGDPAVDAYLGQMASHVDTNQLKALFAPEAVAPVEAARPVDRVEPAKPDEPAKPTEPEGK
jgi:hypothetical protein